MTIKTFNINTDKTAFVRAYLPDSIAGLPFCEKRPAVLIFPGGGYEYCSDREGEPIALQYLALGYAAFVVTYSCNERFPEPLMDAAYIFYKIRMRAEEFKMTRRKWLFSAAPPADISRAASPPCGATSPLQRPSAASRRISGRMRLYSATR